MYKDYLTNFLTGDQLRMKNKYSPEGLRYCNGICQDFKELSGFSTSGKCYKQICNECRNKINYATKLVNDGTIKIDDFKANPDIILC